MGYIYCILNKINNKCYIGKCTNTIESRFKEHIRDSRKNRCKNRPLYRAFNKYGVENFNVFMIELIQDTSQLSEREIFWINKYNTYHFGYNATKGGDGTILYDYEKIINLYKYGYNCSNLSKLFKCHIETIYNVILYYGLAPRKGHPHRIDMFTLDGKFLQYFMGSTEAVLFLKNNDPDISDIEDTMTVNISKCCTGKKKDYKQYVWKYHNFMNNIKDINYDKLNKKSGIYVIKNIITNNVWYGRANNLKKKIISIIDAVNKGKTHTPLYKEMVHCGLEAFEIDFPENIPNGAILIEEINNPPKEKPQQDGLRECPFQYRVNANTVLMAYTEEDLNKLKMWHNIT